MNCEESVNKYQFDTLDISATWQRITAADKITLLAHLRPDADSLGACGALALVLRTHGKEVEIIYPASTADPLPFPLENVHAGSHTQTPDLIISCDASTDERVYTPDEFAGIDRIIIDHHLNNEMAGIYRFVATTASSTCEIMYDLLTAWQQEITTQMAEILLFGIMCDTLTFRLPNTSPGTLRVASDLIEKGANLPQLAHGMIMHDDPAVMQLWGDMLSTIQYTPDKQAIWTVCTQEMLRTYNLDDRAISDFISMLSQTMKTNITILFSELADGSSKASLRGKTADVRSIATQFGGGGHKLAAGISSKISVNELVKKVVSKL